MLFRPNPKQQIIFCYSFRRHYQHSTPFVNVSKITTLMCYSIIDVTYPNGDIDYDNIDNFFVLKLALKY